MTIHNLRIVILCPRGHAGLGRRPGGGVRAAAAPPGTSSAPRAVRAAAVPPVASTGFGLDHLRLFGHHVREPALRNPWQPGGWYRVRGLLRLDRGWDGLRSGLSGRARVPAYPDGSDTNTCTGYAVWH